MIDFNLSDGSGPAGALVCGSGGLLLAHRRAKKLFKKGKASQINSDIVFLFLYMLLNSFIGIKRKKKP